MRQCVIMLNIQRKWSKGLMMRRVIEIRKKKHRRIIIGIFSLLILIVSTPAAANKRNCKVLAESYDSKLYKCENVKVAILKGDFSQRTKDMGSFFKSKYMSSDVIDYYGNFLDGQEKLIAALKKRVGNIKYDDDLLDWKIHALKGASIEQSLFYNRYFNYFNDRWSTLISNTAKAYGIDNSKFTDAVTLPDYIAMYIANTRNSPLVIPLPQLGCTSVYKKIGKSSFYGRNLDYFGTGAWDHYPLLTIHIPKEKDRLPYAAVGAEGWSYGGVTGVNKEGIFLALHMNPTDEVANDSLPVVLIGDQLLQKAKTLEEAINFLKKEENRPGSIWTFVVGSIKEQKISAIEISRNHFHERKMEGSTFTQTNHLQGEDTKKHEWMRSSDLYDSRARYDHAFRALQKNTPSFNINNIIDILGYQEKTGLAQPGDIAKSITLQTMLLEGDEHERKIYLSMDPAPSPTGRYLKLSLNELFEGKPSYEVLESRFLEKRESQERATLAAKNYQTDHDFNATIETLEDTKAKNDGTLNPSEMLLLASAYYNLGQYKESLEITKEISTDSLITSLRQGVQRLRLLSLVLMENESTQETRMKILRQRNRKQLPFELVLMENKFTQDAKNYAKALSKQEDNNNDLEELIYHVTYLKPEDLSIKAIAAYYSFSANTLTEDFQYSYPSQEE